MTGSLHLNICTFMIKSHSIVIKIGAFIDSFTVLFKTHILCSVSFFCNWYIREKLRNALYRQTGQRLHYARYSSHGFTVLDNEPLKRQVKSHLPFANIIRNSPYSPHQQVRGYVYRHTLIKPTVFSQVCLCLNLCDVGTSTNSHPSPQFDCSTTERK